MVLQTKFQHLQRKPLGGLGFGV